MNPLHKELDYSDESSDDDSYTSMSPIKEMRSIDSRLSKSSEYLVDMAVDEDKSKDWADKGMSKSYSIRSQVRVIILLLLHVCNHYLYTVTPPIFFFFAWLRDM